MMEVLEILSDGSGWGGLIGTLIIAFLRKNDKKKNKEALEKQKKEIEEANYINRERDSLLLSRIKGALHSMENYLLLEYRKEEQNVKFPVEVRKDNYPLTMMEDHASSDYSKALIVANKVCRDEIVKELRLYSYGVTPYDLADGIITLTDVIYKMYKEVVISESGYCPFFDRVTNKLQREEVQKNVKVLFNYVVNGDVEQLHRHQQEIGKDHFYTTENSSNNSEGE